MFRFRLPGVFETYQYAETTALPETPENRRALEPACQQIGAEIRAGTFDYLERFPNGRQAARWSNHNPPSGWVNFRTTE